MSTTTTHRSSLQIWLSFVTGDLYRTIKLVQSSFFIIVLPTVLYLMFGAIGNNADIPAGKGNVAAYQMASMGVYGAVIATTSIAGAAATERQRGWGRQLALTGLSRVGYLAGKVAVGIGMAIIPILVLNVVGFATGARFDNAAITLSVAVLSVIGAIPFAFYGLAAALLIRSEAAVSAASGLIVVLAFLGNLFMPLSGSLLGFARFTPLYGTACLARWPFLQGDQLSTSDSIAAADPLWLPLLNIGVWSAVFAVICLFGMKRTTARA